MTEGSDSFGDIGFSVAVVIGTGLIGASVGCALTKAGVQVHLRDRTLSHARVAESRGAGTVAAPEAAAVDLVVVAVPPLALAGVIEDALATYPRAVVTDVGSVKSGVLDELHGRRADLTRYVGSHPMAGSHHHGPTMARGDLFEDRTWVVTPHQDSSERAVATVHQLVTICHANPEEMESTDHDAAVARVSHLPHLVAVLMAGHLTTVPQSHLSLAGPGLRDVTRVAASDPLLWEQILSANATAVLAELYVISEELDGVISAVGSAPLQPGLRHQLERGVEGTRRIPGKHGAAPVSYIQVVVEIPDAPGALARLFADVADAGVNIEDVSIEHDPVREVGNLALSVTPDQEDSLSVAMRARGWDVQP